jgi:hypothetical protein
MKLTHHSIVDRMRMRREELPGVPCRLAILSCTTATAASTLPHRSEYSTGYMLRMMHAQCLRQAVEGLSWSVGRGKGAASRGKSTSSHSWVLPL